MIVQNQTGSGGPKIPEGTFVIVKAYTNASGNVSSQFSAPVSGKYRVTVVGRGGNGANQEKGDGISYGGGGSGGWACSILELKEKESFNITCNNSVSSFGNNLSATAGGTASGVNAGGGGRASGGNLFNYSGLRGVDGHSGGVEVGGNGAKLSEPQNSVFLTDTYGEGGGISWDLSDARGQYPKSKSVFAPFGAGGGGGSKYYADGVGGPGQGGPSAVIIELLLKGVNDT